MPGGTMLGLCLGYCLNRRYVGFTLSLDNVKIGMVKYLKILLRLATGIAGMLFIFIVIQKLLPDNIGDTYLIVFIRNVLGGLWVSIAAPWVFVKLRLAGSSK